ncbi:GGDEF domain-containing protein [Spirochaeta cellobiosiphila]|uniref:GGDEF domain-containing protein n=1 Tax=Spirochaeta cellobiosiphila TaxID=504483 RepID=UPI00041D0F15|nr:GGDEF domain-containing protein [Spirochaeta cellobiosiphila]
MEDWHSNLELLKHYDVLQKTGIWEQLDLLNGKIKDQQELISEAIELFQKDSIDSIIEYVTSKLLNKFVPENLVFLLQEGAFSDTLRTIWFKNMKPYEGTDHIKSLTSCTKFFTEFPNSISFNLLEYKLENESFINSLRYYNPEIIVPIVGIGGLNGLILIGNKVIGEGFDREEIYYLDTLMKFASMSIQNNLNHQSAITDFKTRLYNHSFFIRRLEEELSRLERYDEEAALLVLDVDKFKVFNDTHGHLAGDQVLYHVSRAVEDTIRKGDIAARFGGEEFVVLLARTGQFEAFKVAERIRNKIADMTVDFQGKQLKVTVSIGGCHVNKRRLVHATKLIEQADSALYNSKDKGRNQTNFFEPGFYFLSKVAALQLSS